MFLKKVSKDICFTKTFLLSRVLSVAIICFDGETVAAARLEINHVAVSVDKFKSLTNKRDTIKMINLVLQNMPGSVVELCVSEILL